MNLDVLNEVSKIVKSSKLTECLRLCEFENMYDFINFNEKSIESIEKYVQIKCKKMPLDQRSIYLDDIDIYNPQDFIISPGLRNRLFQAAYIIECQAKSIEPKVSGIINNFPKNPQIVSMAPFYNNNNLIRSIQHNNLDSSNNLTNDKFNHDFQLPEKVNPAVSDRIQSPITKLFNSNKSMPSAIVMAVNDPITVKVTSTPTVVAAFSGGKENTQPQQPQTNNSVDASIDIESYYNSLSTYMNSYVKNINLIPKVDFALEFHIDKLHKDSFGFYICHICGDNRKLMFRFTDTMGIVYSNVKQHVQRHSGNRRRPIQAVKRAISPDGAHKYSTRNKIGREDLF